MTIELIDQEQYEFIKHIQESYEALTYENKGYDSISISELTEQERLAHQQVSEILKKHIVGFSKFNHFKIKDGEIRIRLQYNWCADDTPEYRKRSNLTSFTGVGYLMLRELKNGFDKKS